MSGFAAKETKQEAHVLAITLTHTPTLGLHILVVSPITSLSPVTACLLLDFVHLPGAGVGMISRVTLWAVLSPPPQAEISVTYHGQPVTTATPGSPGWSICAPKHWTCLGTSAALNGVGGHRWGASKTWDGRAGILHSCPPQLLAL